VIATRQMGQSIDYGEWGLPGHYGQGPGSLLEDVGFVDVQHHKYPLPFGARPGDEYADLAEFEYAHRIGSEMRYIFVLEDYGAWSAMSMELLTRYT
jgi:hypothetical protein